jgi:hypothetical protein
MDAKKLSVFAVIAILAFVGSPLALAGPTSLSGTSHCFMPNLLETQIQNPTPSPSIAQAPAQESLTTQKDTTIQKTEQRADSTVVTVCAK